MNECNDLDVLVMQLKSGEYDGTSIMKAWLAIERLIKIEIEDLAPKWVSVGDRLPVDGDDVLVYLNGVANITSMYTDDTDLLRYFDDFESDPPTHWQPLPAAPEAAK